MAFALFYLFFIVLTYLVMFRVALRDKKWDDNEVPREVLSIFAGILWPATIPALSFAWVINKVLDKFTKV